MRALAILAGGVAAAALGWAVPATAQYYPPSPYGYGDNGYDYNGYTPNGYNQQAIVNQCAAAVQQRLSGGYGYGYGNGYARGRVLGISRVEPRGGGVTVRGVATSGRYGGYGYNGRTPDLTWRCSSDFRGVIVGVDIRPAQRNYYGNDYNYQPYSPYDYSQYGYSRY
jgi:hypothetical protein